MLDISNVPEYFNVNMLSNYKLAEIGIPLERFSAISLTLLVLELKSPANAIFL
jgi:hypothetical protein